MILTALVDLLVVGVIGGIVIYFVQQKISASIQRAIQESLIEYQTTYSTNFPKQIEILEELIKRFSELHDSVRSEAMELAGSFELPWQPTAQEISNHQQLSYVVFDDLRKYYWQNRFVLPPSSARELDMLMDDLSDTINILRQFWDVLKLEKRTEYVKSWLPGLVKSGKIHPVNLGEVMDGDGFAIQYPIIDAVVDRMKESREKLEKLYHRIAGIRD
jgi:uncharacterized membrane-anchored protein YhcB (DUF1043 family)